MRDQRQQQTGNAREDKLSPLRTTMAVPRLNQQPGISFPIMSLPSLGSPDETNTYSNTVTDGDEETQSYTLDTFTLNTADIDGYPTFDTIGDDGTALPATNPAAQDGRGPAHIPANTGALFPSGTAALVVLNEQEVLREKRLCLASSFLFFVGTLLSFLYCWLKNTQGLPLLPELVLDLLLCLAHTCMVGHVVFFEFASLDGGFQRDKHLQTRRSLDHMRYAQTVSGKRPFSREIRIVNMAQSILFLLATFVQAVALISVNSYYHQEQQLALRQQQQALAAQEATQSTGYHSYFYYHNYNKGGQADYSAESTFMESEQRDRLMGQYNWLTFISSLLYFFSAATVLVVHAVRTLFDRIRAKSRAGSPNRQLLNHVGKQPPKKLPAKISVTPTLLADIAEHKYATILTLDHCANALYFLLTAAMLIISISALSLEDPDVRFWGDLNFLEILAFLWVWIGALYFVADVMRWSYSPPRSLATVAAAGEVDDEKNPSNGPPPFKSPPSTTSKKQVINAAASRKDDVTAGTPPLYNAKSLPFPTSPQYIPAIEVELDIRSLPPCRGRSNTPRPKSPKNNNHRMSEKNRYVPAIEVELDVRSLPSIHDGWQKSSRKKDKNRDKSQDSIPSNAASTANDDNLSIIPIIDINDNANLVNRIDHGSVAVEDDDNNSGTTNSSDEKHYRSTRDPDGVLQAEMLSMTRDPSSSMLIASESLIENKPSHILATANSLYSTFSNNRNFNHDHDAAGRDASDPIQVQYMAMCDDGDESEAFQHAEKEGDIITLKRGSLSMDTVCSAPPSPTVAVLATTVALSTNNNDDDYVNLDYIAMQDATSLIQTRLANITISQGVDRVNPTDNNSSRGAGNSIKQNFSNPEYPVERFSAASVLQQGTKRNNSDGNDAYDNDRSQYEYSRMDYVSSLRQNYFSPPVHHQEQNEQDQHKSISVRNLRKTPSPSMDGIEIIQVDGTNSAQMRWRSPSSVAVSSTNAISGSGSGSTSTHSGPPLFGRPPQNQHQQQHQQQSSLPPSAPWPLSKPQQHQGFSNISDDHASHQAQHEQQLMAEPDTVDLTAAVEDRDDGSLEHDHNNKSDQDHIQRKRAPSPVRHTSPPSYATQLAPLSWTSIEDRRYQQAQKSLHRNNAASPTQYGRFEDLEHFINQY